MSVETRPFTYGKLGIEQPRLDEIIRISRTQRDIAINSVLFSIRGRRSEGRPVVLGSYANFIKQSALRTVATQVSDRLDHEQKTDYVRRYEASIMGHLVASAYPESSIRNPEEFVKPLPFMARVALVTSMFENGDMELIRMRREQGVMDSPDMTITPSLGNLVAELQDAL